MVRTLRLIAALSTLSSSVIVSGPGYAQTTSPTSQDTAEPQQYERVGTPRAPIKKSPQRLEAEAAEFAAREAGCNAGSGSACGDLGEAYELGIGTPQNRPIAAILYTEGCEAGDADSCHRLGELSLALTDIEARKAAFPAFKRACELGSLDGCASLARSYKTGNGVAADPIRADTLIRETCERGGGAACREYALTINAADPDKQRASEVASLFERACRLDDVIGCTELASIARFGELQPGMPSEADSLQIACNLDHAVSCEMLGDIRYRGDGNFRDPVSALPLYDRACYLEPDYLCERSETVRVEPIEYSACQRGDASACARLGEIYAAPNGPFSDPGLSKAFYEYACYAGAVEACARAGALVLEPVDDLDQTTIAQGFAYLERGCAADELGACHQLAVQIKDGDLIEQDMARYWSLAARMCSGEWLNYCEELEEAYPENPDIPLIEAGIEYIPPIEEGDASWQEPFMSEDEREFLRTKCVTSEIEFRGQLYTDTICIPQEMVIGGWRVKPGNAPWQALIWRPERAFGVDLYPEERVLCGGSLIATGWILTAAHCLNDDGGWINGRGYTVRLGVSNPRADEGVTYPISRIYIHPSYNRSNLAYDIALVRYNTRAGRPGARTYAIRSIAIDRTPPDDRPIVRGAPVYVYGWGWTSAANSGSTAQLKAAKLLLESQASCNSLSGLPRSLWNTKICAAGRNRQQACKGDSGGPLITYDDADNRPRVIGVVSSGNSCGQTGKASRYIRVSSALPWIRRIMGR